MDRRGFTLVELLVTMSIMAIMTTMAVANFRVSEYGDELRYAASNLAAEIRRAQTFALVSQSIYQCREAGDMNGSLCTAGEGGGCGESGRCILDTPRGGYGVRIDYGTGGRTALFFADTGDEDRSGDSDHSYQEYELLRRLEFAAAGRNVSVSAVDPDGGGFLDISFSAPRPTAWFNGRNDSPIATVTLTHAKTGQVRTVRINGISGQVSVE
ncbi:prepilin-type N-terminal cleavage/methylation domain-containing protein [Candidatus Uhrbacteria bacterium]|nr:prepilin-type N-terminal cleavage/methylation domain-containing protein [Candidatus Uhrbacteria bacterium]